MKQILFSKKILLSCLLLGQVAVAENYKKVIFASFENETKAQSTFDKVIGEIQDKIKLQKEKYPFNIIANN